MCFSVSVAGFSELRLQGHWAIAPTAKEKVSVADFSELRLQERARRAQHQRQRLVSVADFSELRLQVRRAPRFSLTPLVSVADFSELRLQARTDSRTEGGIHGFSCWFLWTKIAGHYLESLTLTHCSFSCWFLWTKIAGSGGLHLHRAKIVSVADFSELRLQVQQLLSHHACQFVSVADFSELRLQVQEITLF